MDLLLAELIEEPQVGAVEHTHVVHAVAHHDQTVQADVDVEAGEFVGIQTGCPQNVGMGGATGHDFDPANLLANAAALAAANQTAHVDFKAGFHEGEEAGPHADGNVLAKYLGQDALDHDLTGGEGEIPVHDQGFVLEEGAFVAGVGGFVAVHTARIHETVGGLVGLEIANRTPDSFIRNQLHLQTI